MTASKALRHTSNPKADRKALYEGKALRPAGFAEAHAAITAWPGYTPTPLVELPDLAHRLRLDRLWLKDEGERLGLKSFKALGGAYAVQRLVAEHGDNVTVTCATDGNHGRAVAWGAKTFGARAVIFMPEAVSPGRAAAIASYGAEVRRAPGTYDDVVAFAAAEAKRQGWHLVSDTAAPGADLTTPTRVMLGYGVMAEEVIAQLDGAVPTHVIAQAGVGALAAALCARFWIEWGANRPRMIVVEPETADCVFTSLEEGRPTKVEGDLETMMGGLSCGEISAIAWSILETGADDALAIGDGWVPEAMRTLARGAPPVVAGETGCAGIAALLALQEASVLKHTLGLSPDSCVLVINSEGDTDPALYQEIVET